MGRIEIRVGRPTRDEAKALIDHVVEVADALFIDKGYGATSMARVASRARVGKQTLYRRFSDKADLFREVIRRRIDTTVVSADDSVVSRDPLDELKKLGRAALENALNPELVRLYRVVIAEAVLFPELARAASDYLGSNLKDRCIDAIRKAQATQMCKPGDPEALAHCFLWSLIGEAFLNGLSGQGRLAGEDDRDAHLELVWRVFLDGISIADDQKGESPAYGGTVTVVTSRP
jgi:TetR/AcrR family transcriptional regulator, mexJK operon transcriptional repressor